jgi:predicted outer membrane protein
MLVKKSVSFATVTCLALTSVSFGADHFPADTDFVRKAEQAGAQEVADAQFVLAKAHDPAVRKVAVLLQADGNEAGQQLAMLAVEKGWPAVTVDPPEPMSRYSRARYASRQIRAERQVIAFYAEEATNGTDTKLQEFARAALPTLRRRLETLRRLRTS